MSSDEASAGVTYTSILSDYEEPSNVGSPGVIIYGYDRLPMYPVDPPSLEYMPSPEDPEQAPLSPDYVPGPEYPEYFNLSDEEVTVEDQPYVAADLPIALSPGYIVDSDPEEDPEDESEDGPTDYPADGGDDDDDDDDSSGDKADDEDKEEASEEDEEEEEYLASTDSTAISLVVDPIPSAEETEPFETDESAATPPPPSGTLSSGTPPSWTPPSGTPPLLPIPLPTSSPPLLLPSINYRADVPEVTLPPRKRLCITPGPRYEIRESSSAPTTRLTGGFRADYGFVGTLDAEIRRDPDREIGYGITDIWEDPDEIAEEIPATDVAELGQRMTDFVTTLNLLRRDRRFHTRTGRLMESEARAAREASVQSMDASDTTRSEMIALQIPAGVPTHPDVPEEVGSSS
ncbi:hypothetical protein Tco_1319345 [Tanacetum coccineum]